MKCSPPTAHRAKRHAGGARAVAEGCAQRGCRVEPPPDAVAQEAYEALRELIACAARLGGSLSSAFTSAEQRTSRGYEGPAIVRSQRRSSAAAAATMRSTSTQRRR